MSKVWLVHQTKLPNKTDYDNIKNSSVCTASFYTTSTNHSLSFVKLQCCIWQTIYLLPRLQQTKKQFKKLGVQCFLMRPYEVTNLYLLQITLDVYKIHRESLLLLEKFIYPPSETIHIHNYFESIKTLEHIKKKKKMMKKGDHRFASRRQ